jgi:acetyltransferase-like isoleucine patch superfamily enzyme
MNYFFKKVINKFRSVFKKPKTPVELMGKNLQLGEGSILLTGSYCYFNPKYSRDNRKCILIGNKSLIKASFSFEHDSGLVQIGNNVYIGGATFISRSSIIVGNNVTMAWGITIYDHDAHSVNWEERKFDNEKCYNDFINHNENLNYSKDWSVVKTKEVIIEDNVWIGFDCLILKGVKIGEGAVIGAKSVVTKNVEPYTLVAGNPAYEIKKLKTD